ncbi:hypothetical protein HK101_008280 [Irineochytrium annulatum]|nr:hypothetical protein HK101_008280 [Irineochytrium annulatum]
MTPQRNLANSADEVSVAGLRREFVRAVKTILETGQLEALFVAAPNGTQGGMVGVPVGLMDGRANMYYDANAGTWMVPNPAALSALANMQKDGTAGPDYFAMWRGMMGFEQVGMPYGSTFGSEKEASETDDGATMPELVDASTGHEGDIGHREDVYDDDDDQHMIIVDKGEVVGGVLSDEEGPNMNGGSPDRVHNRTPPMVVFLRREDESRGNNVNVPSPPQSLAFPSPSPSQSKEVPDDDRKDAASPLDEGDSTPTVKSMLPRRASGAADAKPTIDPWTVSTNLASSMGTLPSPVISSSSSSSALGYEQERLAYSQIVVGKNTPGKVAEKTSFAAVVARKIGPESPMKKED